MVHATFLQNRKNWFLFTLVFMLILSAFWFRFVNLGYSNLQSDEIKALCRPAAGETIVNFLLRQRKGPLQFLISCAVREFDPAFSSELILRLPFAISNIVAVFIFYLLVRRMFEQDISLYASLFFATNGLIIGFARIVQYQSITILCTFLGIYGFLRAIQEEKWKIKGLYFGFIAISIGLLAHFDSFFAIPPMVYLLFLWWKKYRKENTFRKSLYHLIVAFFIFLIPLLIFYIPYAYNLAEYQLGYWNARVSTLPPSDTIGLYQLYNPGPILWIYAAFIGLGLFRLRINPSSIILFLWWMPPFIVMEGVMSHPATHFYTYLLPLLVVAALGFESLQILVEKIFLKNARWIIQGIAILVFGFLGMIGHFILIDHTPEYPWNPRVIWKMELTGKNMGATFGFPYNRGWRTIGDWFTKEYQTNTKLVSNEYGKIGRFYMPETIHYVDVNSYRDEVFTDQDGIVMLWIEEPRSEITKIWGIRGDIWKNTGEELKEFRDQNDKLLGTVYYYTKTEIQSMFP